MKKAMRGVKYQSSAIFEHDRRGRLKYYREDWDGVDLPREPSLRLAEDERFFERVSDDNPAEAEKKQNRFLDFISRAGNVSASKKKCHVLSEKDFKAPTKKHTPVPIRVRKTEIELIQRKLPRYPSQDHLSDPTFYPLASYDLFETLPVKQERKKEVSETSERKRVSFSKQIDDTTRISKTEIGTVCLENDSDYRGSITEFEEECSEGGQDHDVFEMSEQSTEESSVIMDEDDTSAAYIETDYDEEEDEYHDESYYSDSEILIADEVSMEADDSFEEFLQMKKMHLQSIKKVEPQPEPDQSIKESISNTIADERIEESKSHIIDEPSKKNAYKPSLSKPISFSTKYLPETRYAAEDGTYLREVGSVPPLVRMMIFQARMELRSRKVTEEHKEELKPTLAEAILMARDTRLDEHIIETRGKNHVKYDDAVIPSTVWVKGEESVSLPKFGDPTPKQFLIFKEAVALGGIKALKPEITMNYDPLASIKNCYNDVEIDVDDANRHKLIRTKYLTDMYLQDEWRAESDDDEDEESLHYASLDDVEVPTNACPVYRRVDAKVEEQELKDLIAQQVAEAVWERRYRLERPRAKQRIKYRCTCKYCKTSSTYQTFAYRKRWLVQQKLWDGSPPDDSTQEVMDVPLMNDPTEDMELKKTSFRTTSTHKLSVGDFSRIEPQTVSCDGEVEPCDNISVSTKSGFNLPQSKSFKVEEFELMENKKSYEKCIVIPAQSMPEGQEEQKADGKKKTFMNRSSIRGIRSLFSN